jgi:hypothetical protein
MNTAMGTGGSAPAAAAAFALVVSFAGDARAVETRADVETDHLDAADDGGPRSAGVLIHSLPTALGSVGVEVDVALGANAALSVEGDWLPLAAIRMTTTSVGMPLFTQRFAFHGFYVHPRFEWAWARAPGMEVEVGGAAVLVGYEWTWLPGATIRLSGGVAYSKAMSASAALSPALVGIHPELDAALGWIF